MSIKMLYECNAFTLNTCTESGIVTIDETRSNREGHSFNGKLLDVFQAKSSGKLILRFLNKNPVVYDPKDGSIANIIKYEDVKYRVLGEKYLLGDNKVIFEKIETEYQKKDYQAIMHFMKDEVKVSVVFNPESDEKDKKTRTYDLEFMRMLFPMNESPKVVAIDLPTPTKENAISMKTLCYAKESLKEEVNKKKKELCIDQEGKYAIVFSPLESVLSFYAQMQNGMYHLIKEKNYSQNVKSVCFLGENDCLVTLHQDGKLRVLRIEEIDIKQLQSIEIDELPNKQVYERIAYISKKNYLACRVGNRIDYFSIHLDTYNKKKKNRLLQFKTYREKQADAKEANDNTEKLKIDAEKAHSISARAIEIYDDNKKQDQQRDEKIIKSKVEITVGIDFGTSRTKISYRTKQEEEAVKLLIFDEQRSLNEVHDYENWSLPSMVAESGGEYSFAYDALNKQDAKIYDRLKPNILQDKVNHSMMAPATAYIAYLFELSERMIKQELHAGEECVITYSICLPVEQMNNNLAVVRMHKVLYAAEKLYRNKDYHFPKRVIEHLNSVFKDETTTELQISQIIPESAAEVVDYHMRLPDTGYFFLIDFGAGTTDFSIFHLYSGRKRSAEILGAKIVYKGFADIEKEISKNPEKASNIITNHYKSIYNELKESGIFKEVKEKRQGHESASFMYNYKVLASGGASQNEIIQRIFQEPMRFDNDGSKGNMSFEVLNDPSGWDAAIAPYYRCAVAYGLSENPIMLKERYILPKDCKVSNNALRTRVLTEDEIEENKRNFIK